MDAPTENLSHAAAVHAQTLILDSHIDIPWPPDSAGPFGAESRRCVSLSRMREGGVSAGCFAAFVPQGTRDAAGQKAAIDRARAMLDTIETMGGGEVRVCGSAAAIEAAWASRIPAVVPCIENGHAIGQDLGLLREFRARGCTYVTLTHNGHNLLADSAVPRPDLADPPVLHGGLSDLGRAAITEMNNVGLMIDVAHASRDAMMQAAAASRTPIVTTHSSVRTLCDHPRNLDDGQLDAVAAVGGVVQITMVAAFLRKGGRTETVTLSDLLDHIDYAVSRMGIDHVGIGTDFDGGGGVVGFRHAGEAPALTAGLLARGYDATSIGLLWGGNFLRVMRSVEEAAL